MLFELAQRAMAGTLHSRPSDGHDGSPENLLVDAATCGLQQRAGYVVCHIPVLESIKAHPERINLCSDFAADILDRLLVEGNRRLLREWVRLCAYVGQRAPAEYAESLLNCAVFDETIIEDVQQIVGERGHWLAQYRRAWQHIYLVTEPESYFNRDLSAPYKATSAAPIAHDRPGTGTRVAGTGFTGRIRTVRTRPVDEGRAEYGR